MSLDASISKAISVAAFFGLTLAPPGEQVAPSSLAGLPPAQAAMPTAHATPETHAANAKSVESATKVDPPGPCASGMLLVEGDYCPDAEQVCLNWLDPPPYQNLRCGEYAKPTKCKGARQHRRFCVDQEEYSDPATSGADPKDALPMVNKSWGAAKSLCEARGARLCKETEWEFACEGVEMNPYPYGFKRDSTLCNHDRTDLGGAQDKLTDHRAPVSAFPACVSPFGAHDMIGNVDEWVEREGVAAPRRSALRGGWWLPGRNRCRAATTHHEESYSGKQVGFRCCSDVK